MFPVHDSHQQPQWLWNVPGTCGHCLPEGLWVQASVADLALQMGTVLPLHRLLCLDPGPDTIQSP